MFSPKRGPVRFFWLAAIVAAFSPLLAFAQSDPDPNSPSPIILSVEGKPRLLTYRALRSRKYSLEREPVEALRPGWNAVMFVTNLRLLEGEGANAFRIYARDENERMYRFPVLDIRPAEGRPDVYAVTFKLRDEIGYWQEPIKLGDLAVRLSWRGMTSNELLLAHGSKGGKLMEDKSLKSSSLSEIQSSKGTPEDSLTLGIGYKWSGDRVRFLEQATFGPTQSLDARLRRIGLRVWLAEQFDKPYPSPAYPYPNIPLKNTNRDDVATGCGPFADTVVYRTCIREHYTMYPLQNWFFLEALYGDAQLRHRVAWALGQIWVTSGLTNDQSSWMIAYHKVLSKNAFGNYRDLMKEMTLNPAMGNYLDMVRSTRNNPNENYPREILQLFSVGLFELNQDGTLKLDTNGNAIETYDQADVNNFTKVFTGWSFCNTGCPNSGVGVVNYKDPIVLNHALTNVSNNRHDLTAKTLFDYPGAPNPTIPACTGTCDDTLASIATYANTSLDQTLDNIFYHPNVGPFVSKILIQHLVTSDPSPAYVSRVAGVFNNNGSGVRGDLKAVVKAILLDPEARGDVKTDPNFGKLREPVQLMTNLFRQVGVTGANFTGLSDGVINGRTSNLGQNAFYSPTVFNYYPPDYVIPGTALLGPEFALMTSGSAVGRLNFVNTTVMNDNAVGINAETSPNGTSLDIRELESIAAADTTSNRLLDTLNTRLLHGTMTPATRTSILTAVNAIATTNPRQRARQAVYLVATSSQFQVQR